MSTDAAHAATPSTDDHRHHPGDVSGETHGQDDHGETHGHDDHAHGSEALGPIDTTRWGAFAGGILLGLIVAVCIAFTTGLAG